ncbi:MAG: YcxB family protein [Defluviitaleaceae bacterium]|nr:YcxB family protein [Defluviitaleaceae bacterium]
MDFDKEPIEVITPYTYEDSKTFLRYHSRFSVYYGVALMLIYGAILVRNYLVTGTIGNVMWGALIFASAIFLIVIARGTFFTESTYDRTHRNVSKGFKYLFRNDEVVLKNLLTAEEDDTQRAAKPEPAAPAEPDALDASAEAKPHQPEPPRGRNILPYEHIVKIAETKDAYYMYVNRNIAFIVTKAGFVTGKTYNFDSLMEDKLGARFRQMKNKG